MNGMFFDGAGYKQRKFLVSNKNKLLNTSRIYVQYKECNVQNMIRIGKWHRKIKDINTLKITIRNVFNCKELGKNAKMYVKTKTNPITITEY